MSATFARCGAAAIESDCVAPAAAVFAFRGGSTTYRFADFVLDVRRRQLLREGRHVHLSPKAFDLLAALVENRSAPMTRAELHDRIWPKTFVQDTNLASLVSEVRRALDDDADEPIFVRTIHRFGYWFVCRVQSDRHEDASVKPAIRHWLVWETRQVALAEGENIVGRAPDAAVWLDAIGVSRNHARITISGGRAAIEDLDSKNGTFVGGERVTGQWPLSDGDQIRLGSVVVTFRMPEPAAATESLSPV